MRNKQSMTIEDTGIISNIGELKTSQSNTNYRSFAVNLDGCGEQEFLVFRDKASSFSDEFKVGEKVFVRFSISSRRWIDKNHIERIAIQLYLESINKNTNKEKDLTSQQELSNDDLPF